MAVKAAENEHTCLGEIYQINRPILAILSPPDGERVALTIPEGSLVTVVAGPLNGNRLVEVLWKDSQYLVFTG
ncbi:MAG: hypothetical protein WDO18_12055 [Acidobacteriota bacterium]